MKKAGKWSDLEFSDLEFGISNFVIWKLEFRIWNFRDLEFSDLEFGISDLEFGIFGYYV